MPAITTTSERTGRWTKMHRPFVPFSVPESSAHTRSLADCITTTFGFRFSVHTGQIVAIPVSSGLHHQYVLLKRYYQTKGLTRFTWATMMKPLDTPGSDWIHES